MYVLEKPMAGSRKIKTKPYEIKGGISIDARGRISYVNGFEFADVKRFYIVENSKPNIFRGWHGHKSESKYVFVAAGIAVIAVVRIRKWSKPSKQEKILTFTLSEHDSKILCIPAGFANGFYSLVPKTKVIFYSTSTLQESLNDDVRYEPTYWNLHEVTANLYGHKS